MPIKMLRILKRRIPFPSRGMIIFLFAVILVISLVTLFQSPLNKPSVLAKNKASFKKDRVNDINNEGTMVWANGDPFYFASWRSGGNPNSDSYDCVGMATNYKYQNFSCESIWFNTRFTK